MTMQDYIKFVAALLFVLGLMGGLALILRRFGLGAASMLPADRRRLKVLEILPLDARRKAVLISRDSVEHLVILGGTSETVVETNINASTPDVTEGKV
jgi:flagellar protein FliO/FliZ